ncbi:MAG: glutamyl-tRNA reductase [Myxococcota bacterium]
MRLVVLGLNHKTAPVATREAFAVPQESVHGLDRRLVLEPAVAEAMVVSTCNRVELYAVPDGDDEGTFESTRRAMIQVLCTERGLDEAELAKFGYSHSGESAVRHLVKVCSSLDSLVVGEAQILAQVKEAFGSAREAGSVGPVLEQVVQAAFRGAKQVRTDTGIAEESVSIGSVAVELARRIFPALNKCQVLVIGAGKMGRVTARSLARHGVREVVVTNRSLARAQALAAELGWIAKEFADLDLLLTTADVVLTCTGADRPILDPKRMKAVMKRRKFRPIFMVDIAVPRDIDPAVAELDNVYLYNVDDLEAVSKEHLAMRQSEAKKAEVIVEQTVREALAKDRVQTVGPVLKAVRDRAEAVLRGELERQFGKRLQHLGASDRSAIEGAALAALNKLLHPTMTVLREHSGRTYDMSTSARMLWGIDSAPPAEEAPVAVVVADTPEPATPKPTS